MAGGIAALARRLRPRSNGIRSAASCSGSRRLRRSLTADRCLLRSEAMPTTISDAMRRGLLRILHADRPARLPASRPSVDAPDRSRHRSGRRHRQMMTLTLNLWLAPRCGGFRPAASSLAGPQRPSLPPMTLVALCVALAFCFFGGMIGDFRRDRHGRTDDGLCAGRLCRSAYAHAGLEEPRHSGSASPTPSSSCSAWPVIAMVILGLADAVFGFRERFLRNRQPPPLPTT